MLVGVLATPAFGQAASTPGGATPTAAPVSAPPLAVAKKAPAKPRIGVGLSLTRVLAPMLNIKGEYAIDDHMVAGLLLATGSPQREGLTEYSQHELGAFFSYYALGDAYKGIGAVLQARGYMSSGKQEGDGDTDPFDAEGSAWSVGAFVSGRYVVKNRLLLQADYGMTYLSTKGKSTSNGQSSEAVGSATGSLFNIWVGLVF